MIITDFLITVSLSLNMSWLYRSHSLDFVLCDQWSKESLHEVAMTSCQTYVCLCITGCTTVVAVGTNHRILMQHCWTNTGPSCRRETWHEKSWRRWVLFLIRSPSLVVLFSQFSRSATKSLSLFSLFWVHRVWWHPSLSSSVSVNRCSSAGILGWLWCQIVSWISTASSLGRDTLTWTQAASRRLMAASSTSLRITAHRWRGEPCHWGEAQVAAFCTLPLPLSAILMK